MTEELDRFVLGGAPLGGLYSALDDDTAAALLQAAWECGVRSFDTAPHYGAGLSERRLGAFLRQHPREAYSVSTKVGRPSSTPAQRTPRAPRATSAPTASGGCATTAATASSARSTTACAGSASTGSTRFTCTTPTSFVDEAVVHACPALIRLRDEGVIRHVGAGMNHVAPLLRIVRETDVDQIMVAGRYTLLDRSAGEHLLPACSERGVRVVAAGLYNSGVLADPRPGAHYDYAPADAATVERALGLRELCAAHGVPLRAAASSSRWVILRCGAVAVGCRDTGQVLDAVRMLGTPLPPALREALAMP